MQCLQFIWENSLVLSKTKAVLLKKPIKGVNFRDSADFAVKKIRQLLTHYGCFWIFLSEKYLIQISILGTKQKQIRKSKGTFAMSILKVDFFMAIFFLIFIVSLLKLRFVSNTFWTKICKIVHCQLCNIYFLSKSFQAYIK